MGRPGVSGGGRSGGGGHHVSRSSGGHQMVDSELENIRNEMSRKAQR